MGISLWQQQDPWALMSIHKHTMGSFTLIVYWHHSHQYSSGLMRAQELPISAQECSWVPLNNHKYFCRDPECSSSWFSNTQKMLTCKMTSLYHFCNILVKIWPNNKRMDISKIYTERAVEKCNWEIQKTKVGPVLVDTLYFILFYRLFSFFTYSTLYSFFFFFLFHSQLTWNT